MSQSKKTIILCSLVVIFSIGVVGIALSYAFFAVSTVRNVTNQGDEIKVTTDTFDINFSTTKYINNENILLIKSDEVATKSEKVLFSVSKKSGVNYNIRYNISLSSFSISSNLVSQDFKWELLENNVSIYSGTFASAVSGTDFKFNSVPIVLEDDSADYELRVWLQETSADQTNLFNGSFSGKVSIEAFADRS